MSTSQLLGRWPLARASRLDEEGLVWLRLLEPEVAPPRPELLRDGVFPLAVRPHLLDKTRLTGWGLTGLSGDHTEQYEVGPATEVERDEIEQFERRLSRMPLEVQTRVRALVG